MALQGAPVSTIDALATTAAALGKTISGLVDVADPWEKADANLRNLIARLAGLKITLGRIRERLEKKDSAAEQDSHQLVKDLGVCMTYCIPLVSGVSVEISGVYICRHHTVQLVDGKQHSMNMSGLKSETEAIRKIQRLAYAFDLLFAACNCKTTSEQELLLNRPTTRKAFKEVMKDLPTTLSVHNNNNNPTTTIHAPTARCYYYADSSLRPKIRRVLRACHESTTFISKIYRRVLLQGPQKVRHLFREECKSIEARRRSRQVDAALKRDAKTRTCKVYVGGSPFAEASKFCEQIKIISRNGYTDEERLRCRDSVRETVLKIARTVAETLLNSTMKIESHNKLLARRLLEELDRVQPDSSEITPMVARAMKNLSESSRELLSHVQDIAWSSISNYTLPYFFDEIERIAQPDYIPSESDIVRSCRSWCSSPEARTVKMSRMNIQFVSSSSRGCCRGCSSREFIKTLVEDTKAVVWVVDLVSYDQELTGYDDVDDDGVQQLTTMQESLRMFDSVVNSTFFVDCPFIILFTNVSAFKEKLARTPMSSRFPDYYHYYVQASSDDDDDDDDNNKEVNRASKYLLQRFSRLDSRNHDIHSYLFDAVDSVQLQRVLAAVEETLLAKAKMKTKTKTKTVRRCRARVARPTS